MVFFFSEDLRTTHWNPCSPVWLISYPSLGSYISSFVLLWNGIYLLIGHFFFLGSTRSWSVLYLVSHFTNTQCILKHFKNKKKLLKHFISKILNFVNQLIWKRNKCPNLAMGRSAYLYKDLRTPLWNPCPQVWLISYPSLGPVYTYSEDLRTTHWNPCSPVWLISHPSLGSVYIQWGSENTPLKPMSTSLINIISIFRPCIYLQWGSENNPLKPMSTSLINIISIFRPCIPSEDLRTTHWNPCQPVWLISYPSLGSVYTYSKDLRTTHWNPCSPVWLISHPYLGSVYIQWGSENNPLKPMFTSLINITSIFRLCIHTVRIWEQPTETHVHQSD